MGTLSRSAPGQVSPSAALIEHKSAGYYERAFRRLARNRIGWIGILVLLINILCAAFAPRISPYPPLDANINAILQAPSISHWMGTDELGRDILSRTIYGAQISLMVMAISIILALVFGSLLGLISGYIGGGWDDLIMRTMDGLLAFPMLILALAIVAALGPKLENAMIAIAIVTMPSFARLVRGEVLALKSAEFVTAAQCVGCPDRRVILSHIWPNVTGTVIVFASLRAASAIITEASLSFLGLGAQPPTATWGSMVAYGMSYWNLAWWMSFFPGLAIFITVLGLNFLGDGLRDAFDTRLQD